MCIIYSLNYDYLELIIFSDKDSWTPVLLYSCMIHIYTITHKLPRCLEQPIPIFLFRSDLDSQRGRLSIVFLLLRSSCSFQKVCLVKLRVLLNWQEPWYKFINRCDLLAARELGFPWSEAPGWNIIDHQPFALLTEAVWSEPAVKFCL